MSVYALTNQRIWLGRVKGFLASRLSLSEASTVRARDTCTEVDSAKDAAVDCTSSEETLDWQEPNPDFSAYAPWEVSATAHNENQHGQNCPWEEAVWEDISSPERLIPSADSRQLRPDEAHQPEQPLSTAVYSPDTRTDEPDTPTEQSHRRLQNFPREEAVWDATVFDKTSSPTNSGSQLRQNDSDPTEPPRTAAVLSPNARADSPYTPAKRTQPCVQDIPWEEATWDETLFDDTPTTANSGSQLRAIEPDPSQSPRTTGSCVSDESGNVTTGHGLESGSTTEDRKLVLIEAGVERCEPGGTVDVSQEDQASKEGPRQWQAETGYSNELPDDYDALDMAAQRIREAAVKQRTRKAVRDVGDDPSQIDLFVDVEQPSTSASSLSKTRVTDRRPASSRVRNAETKAAVEAIIVPTKKARRGRKPNELVLR